VQYSDLSRVNRKGSVDWITEARQLRPGVHFSRTVVQERSEDVPLRVANLTEDPIPIPVGTILAKLDVAEVCEIEEPATLKKRSEMDPVL